MDIGIRFVSTPIVDRPELGQYFESTEPYTGCGCIHYYYDRSTNTSASECNGNIQYGLGMEKLPKWQHKIVELAIKYNVSWDQAYSEFLNTEREYSTKIYANRKSFYELLSLTENKF